MNRQAIKDKQGVTIGWIEDGPIGDKVAKSFDGATLGRYEKKRDYTLDFYGRPVYKGDATAVLIYTAWAEKEAKKRAEQEEQKRKQEEKRRQQELARKKK